MTPRHYLPVTSSLLIVQTTITIVLLLANSNMSSTTTCYGSEFDQQACQPLVVSIWSLYSTRNYKYSTYYIKKRRMAIRRRNRSYKEERKSEYENSWLGLIQEDSWVSQSSSWLGQNLRSLLIESVVVVVFDGAADGCKWFRSQNEYLFVGVVQTIPFLETPYAKNKRIIVAQHTDILSLERNISPRSICCATKVQSELLLSPGT